MLFWDLNFEIWYLFGLLFENWKFPCDSKGDGVPIEEWANEFMYIACLTPRFLVDIPLSQTNRSAVNKTSIDC